MSIIYRSLGHALYDTKPADTRTLVSFYSKLQNDGNLVLTNVLLETVWSSYSAQPNPIYVPVSPWPFTPANNDYTFNPDPLFAYNYVGDVCYNPPTPPVVWNPPGTMNTWPSGSVLQVRTSFRLHEGGA